MIKDCLYCRKEIVRQPSHFDENQTYCSQRCFADFRYLTYIKEWKDGKVNGGRANGFLISNYVRRYLFEKYENKCCKCGWNETNQVTGKSPLQINHIDGNSVNNLEENLELLCPNCHSLTPTFMALNKGKGNNARTRYFKKCRAK
jgi:hypothetical protein